MKFSIKLIVGLVFGSVLFLGCNNADDADGGTDSITTLNGYVVVTSIGDPVTFNATFHEEFPNGDLDNTQGKAFQRFNVREVVGNALITNITDASNDGLARIVVNESGEIITHKILPSVGFAFPIRILSETEGIYDDQNDASLEFFNPQTMTKGGTIDMDNALQLPNMDRHSYFNIIPVGNKLFVPYRPQANGELYSSDSVMFHVIDRTTRTYEKTIIANGHQLPNSYINNLTDNQGNFYIATQGDISVPNFIKPAILKIPAGTTEFDESYTFRPIDQINQALPIQLITDMIVASNGKAYILGGTEVPPGILQLFAIKPSFADWTPEDYAAAFDALFNEPSARWMEVDLDARSVRILQEIPVTGPFSSGFPTEIDGKLYFSVSSPAEAAYYEYDPVTDKATRVINFTGGSTPVGIYKIGN